MQWLTLRRFRGSANIHSESISGNVQFDSPSVSPQEQSFPQESLHHVLSLLDLLLTDERRFKAAEKDKMRKEKEVLTTVMCGVEMLIERGFDYPPETQAFLHFSARLRDIRFRGRSGPQLEISRNLYKELKTRNQSSEEDEGLPDCMFSEEDLQHLMTVLSSGLVFRNYNRSIRIMHRFFSSAKPCVSSAQTSTVEWLREDLRCIGVEDITSIEMVPTEKENKQHAKAVLDKYKTANESLEKVMRMTLSTYASLEPIHAHPEGGRLRSKRRYVVLSRAYVIVVFTFSMVVAILNFGNRDNVFERIFDAVQVSTLLLVTIFGLVKLTSEDPNVIRNNFLGYRVVRSARDVVRAWGLNSEDEVKKALAYSQRPQGWLDKDGSCYVVTGRGRGILLSYGIESRLLYEIGGDFDDNRYFRGNDTKGHLIDIESSELKTAHFRETDIRHLFPILSQTNRMVSLVGTMNCK